MPFFKRISTALDSLKKRLWRRRHEKPFQQLVRDIPPEEANMKAVLRMLIEEEKQLDPAHRNIVIARHNKLLGKSEFHEGTLVPIVTGKLRADKFLLDAALQMARLKQEYFEADMGAEKNKHFPKEAAPFKAQAEQKRNEYDKWRSQCFKVLKAHFVPKEQEKPG